MLTTRMLSSVEPEIVAIEKIRPGSWWQSRNVSNPCWRPYLITGGEAIVKHHGQRFFLAPDTIQAIWVDKSNSGSATPDGTGVTVGVLHAGTAYPDDSADDGLIYHYPRTDRPRGRDLSKVDATKSAGRLGLPVLVITSYGQSTRL